MRVRPVLIAVPACAAAGAVSFSFVGAQEPPPAGYYPPRVSPAPVQQKPLKQQLLGEPTSDRSRSGGPVSVGPNPTKPGTAPVTLPPPKLFFPDPQPARTGGVVPSSGVAQPSGVMQAGGAAPVPPPRLTDLPTTPAGPRVLTEPADPKPLPLVPPNPTAPASPQPLPVLPGSTVLVSPSAPTVAPSAPAMTAVPLTPFTTEPAVEPKAVPLPALSASPTTGPVPLTPPAAFPSSAVLSPRAAPAVTLDVEAPKEVGVGQPLEYVLIVRNTGSSAVAFVRVEDELSPGARLVSSDPPAEQIGDRLSWAVGSLEANGEKRVKVIVKPADEGELRTRAVVSFAAAAEAKVKVTRPKVAVALESVSSARVGDEVVFTIRVSNAGTGTANKVLIQAKLSDGLHRPEGGVIEAELKDLPPGDSKPVALRVLATQAGPQHCTLTVAADGNPAESARAAVSVVEPMLTASLAGPARCLVRNEPEYRIELANPGTASTDPVQMWVVLPDGFEFVSAADGGAYQPANRSVVWRLAGLPAGTNRTVGLKLRAAAPADGTLKVVAQATPTGIEPAGGVPGSGRGGRVLEAKGETAVRAEGVPGLRFEVADLDDPIEVGKEAVYEVKVVNQGTGPCTNVVVTAALADGTVATGASGATQGRGAGQQVVFDPLPQLGVKGEAVFRVRVKGTQPGDHKVRVQVSCDQIKSPITKEENTRFYNE